MKRKIAFFRNENPTEGITKSKSYCQYLLSIVLLFFLYGLSINSMFAQEQQDLRLLTDAYTDGQCPANDIRVISASIDTGSPCNTCESGPVTAPLTIRVNHNTESSGRHLAICGTIVETLPGGGTVNHNLSMCFGPLLKNSEQIGGGQDLAPVDFTFTCGSTLVITDILLVWTAANGECPVTLANNPNGKYCWDNPDVNIPTAINATETHVDAECFGSATGSINLSVTGGVPPYTYAWTASNGGVIPAGQADDQDLSGLVAGTYSVVVTDSKGCTDTVSGIAIGQDPLAVPEITKAPGGATTLCGVSNPQAAIDTAFNTWLNDTPVPTGGTGPYGTVTITDPANPQAPSFTGGFTTVTWSVTDACGQTDTVTATFTVLNPCAPVCEIIDSSDPACFGDVTGSITVRASAGFPAYIFYLYDTSDLTQSLTNSGAINNDIVLGVEQSFATYTFTGLSGDKTYLVVVTDTVDQTPIPDIASSCQVLIDQPDAALSSQISDVDVLCYGAATGSIDLSPSGGTPPYTYAWTASNGGVIPAGQADDQDLSGLVAGTYSVVITDANGTTGGCRAENSAVISQPAATLTSQISDVDVLCFGAATGSINLSPSGGTPPYAYAWSASNGGVIPAGQEDDQDLSGLVAGTYSVVITDANGNTGGCRAENSTVISQPEAGLSSQISDVDVLCYGAATGSINLTPSGGVPPYAYAWSASNGGVIPAGQEDDQDLSGLVAGTYSVVITDANGNVGACRAENSAIISQPDAALSSQISDVDVLCYGAATGSIDLSPSGGTPPYTYAWTASNGGVIPAGQADDQDLSGLVAGTYSVVITDANGTTGGCRAENSAVISQPAAALTSQISDVDVLCFGAATGSINLSPSGGTPPYAYAWSASNGGVIPAGQEDDQDLSGLVAGTYSVVITDANGNTGGCRAENSAVISQPEAGLSATETHVDVLCYGGATGSIDLSPSGGVPPYAYAWSASDGGVIPAGQADDQDLSGLVAGTYEVIITDANGNAGGCRATKLVIIIQPDAPLTSQISDVDVLCFGAATGSIDLSPSGGTPPYAYAWSASNGGVIPAGQADDQDLSGLVAGTYSVVITDANGNLGGCRAENSAVISQPDAALSSLISDVDVLCYGGSTGSINLSPSGGTPPYTYAWSATNGGVVPAGQEDDQDLSGLVAGTYSVVITDANGTTGGCRAENSAVISQPQAALSLILSSDPENCVGTESGSITAEFSGGTSPYTVYLNDVSVGEVTSPYNFTNLGTGSYTIKVVDANDCEISDAETVDLIPCEGPNCTYTQGYYGAYNGSACTPDGLPTYDHQIMVNAVTQAGGFYRFGSFANNKYFTLYLSDVNGNPVIADNNIFKMLPGGGTPRALTGIATYANTATWGYVPISSGRGKYGAIGNVLLSQTMTLFFNKSLDPGLGAVELETTFATADVDCGSDIPDMSSIQVFTIPQSVITYLNNNGGANVNNLFILANNVLGGLPNLPSPSAVNAAVDAINRGFDECRVSVSVPVDTVVSEGSESSTEAMFSAYPIPFKEYINVRYEFDYQSKARIEVYDAKGLFVMAYNDADAYFNKEVRLDVTFNHGEGQMFFVKVITDKGVSTKKIVSKN